MLRFPGLDVIHGEQEVRILLNLLRAIDDIDGADEFLGRDRVCRAVLVILAGDPMLGRVEMRARMFAKLQPVPGPERALVVVMRDGVDLHLRRVEAD